MSDDFTVDWIAVDWGTSALRAWALDENDHVLADAASADGMGRLAPGEFEGALLRLIEDWLPATAGHAIPVVACGMVGARQGWTEAAYRPAPCPPLGLPFSVPATRDPRIAVNILTGLAQNPPPDVMRGEETQVAGLLHEDPAFDGTVCLPGTHTKWADVSGGQVRSFRTFMTGELFDLLSRQSVLRHGMATEGWSATAFAEGVAESMARPESIAATLFALRAGTLVAGLDGMDARSRLSGLLIGLELAGARDYWQGLRVTLIGGDRLADAYATALSIAGATSVKKDATAITLAGLTAARRLYKETATA
jgi:2-dehydro-3-deoxygalactonokinase